MYQSVTSLKSVCFWIVQGAALTAFYLSVHFKPTWKQIYACLRSGGCSHCHIYACLNDLLRKVRTFLYQCELQECDLLYFIGVFHTDLLYEKFQPLIKTVGQTTVQGLKVYRLKEVHSW